MHAASAAPAKRTRGTMWKERLLSPLRYELNRSGLTPRQFAREIGVDYARLQYWLVVQDQRAALQELRNAIEESGANAN